MGTKLNKILCIPVVLVLLLAMTVVPAFAVDNPQQSWSQTYVAPGSQLLNYKGIEEFSIGYYGATWQPSRNAWETNWRIVGLGESRDGVSGNPVGDISQSNFAVQARSGTQTIWTTTDPTYVGAWPESGNGASYYNFAYSLISLAVGTINPIAGFAMGAGDLVNQMVSMYSSGQTSSQYISRTWTFFPYKSDAAHWFWWIHDFAPNQQAQFSVSDSINGPGFLQSYIGGTFTVNTPSAPGRMSESDKLKYGLEIIPVDNLTSRAAELGIAPETVKELQKTGEPVYYLHKVPITMVKIESPVLNNSTTG